MTDEVVTYEGDIWLIEPTPEKTYLCESEGCEAPDACADWYLTSGDAGKFLCEGCLYPVGVNQ